MKRFIVFISFFMAMCLSGCTTITYMVSGQTFENAISSVEEQLSYEGFYKTGVITEVDRYLQVLGVSYTKEAGFGTVMGNDYVYNNKYIFADEKGNTLSYKISYTLRNTLDMGICVNTFLITEFQTSNPKDYTRLRGIINQFNNMPMDEVIVSLW